MGSRGAAFLYLEALNLQAMATPAGAGRGGCQRREVLGMCAARRQNSVTQLLLPGLPVLLCTHRASGTTSRSLPSLLVSKAHCCEKAGRLTAGIRSIPGVCCPAAELALPAGGSVGGSPHLPSTSALPAPAQHPPWDTPTTSDRGVPVLHHSLRLSPDECCGCCRGHCTLPEAAAAASWRHRVAQKYSETDSCS